MLWIQSDLGFYFLFGCCCFLLNREHWGDTCLWHKQTGSFLTRQILYQVNLKVVYIMQHINFVCHMGLCLHNNNLKTTLRCQWQLLYCKPFRWGTHINLIHCSRQVGMHTEKPLRNDKCFTIYNINSSFKTTTPCHVRSTFWHCSNSLNQPHYDKKMYLQTYITIIASSIFLSASYGCNTRECILEFSSETPEECYEIYT